MAVIKQWTGTEWVVMTTGYTGSAGTSNVYDVAVANGYIGSEGGFYADLAALSELSTALAEL